MNNKVMNVQLNFATTDKNLRAWNSADEYLVREAEFIDYENVLVVNDFMGAVSKNIEGNIFCYSDTLLSEDGIKFNCLEKNITFTTPYDFIGVKFDLVLLKIPKSLEELDFYLAFSTSLLKSSGVLIASGMQKYLTKNFYELFSKYFNSIDFLLGIKKAKAISCKNPKPINFDFRNFIKVFKRDGITPIKTLPPVFSYNKIDRAALVLAYSVLEDFSDTDKLKSFNIADLGCGNALITAYLIEAFKKSEFFCFDNSISAVESARLTLAKYSNVSIFRSNFFDVKKDLDFDIIVCNPPFHIEQKVVRDIAFNMFKEARKHLKENGVVYIVANRNLPYGQTLSRLFSNVSDIATNPAYRVYKCKLN